MRLSYVNKSMFVIGLLLSAVLAGCGGGEAATPTPAPTRVQATATPRPTATSAPLVIGGNLRLVVSSLGTESLDPRIESGQSFATNAGGIFDTLLWRTAEGAAAPGVATDWQMAPDAKSWTFKLRAMKFHNGDSITSEDVKFSLERILEPEARSTNTPFWKATLDRVETPAPDTAAVVTKTPAPLTPFLLSSREAWEGSVLPKKAVTAVGTKAFFDNPVGSGPWRFKGHDAGVRFIYEANKSSHPYRPTPQSSTAEIALATEESTRVSMLLSGQADIIETAPDSVARIQSAGFKLLEIAGGRPAAFHFFGFGDPRFKDTVLSKREVRLALSLAVNRQEIVKTILQGFGEVPARHIVLPGSLGYDPTWKPDAYDPAQARQLLAQAGYPNGFTIKYSSFAIGGAGWLPKMNEAVAGYWANIGVKTEIVPVDYGAFTAVYRQRPQPDNIIGTAVGHVGEGGLVNINILRAHYHSKGVLLLLGTPEADAAIDEATTTLDSERRVDAIRRVVELAYSERVTNAVVGPVALYAAAKNVDGWAPWRSTAATVLLDTVRRR